MKLFAVIILTWATVQGGQTSNGIKPSNILGGSDQHASFSFVRPGLTQTSFAFNGPSSHQSFSSSIGNAHLAQKVLPNVANALAYRNPGLGYFSTSPISSAVANSPHLHYSRIQPNAGSPVAFSYQQQAPLDQSMAQAYMNLYQQYQQQARDAVFQNSQQYQDGISPYQAQLGQLLALSQQQAQLHANQNYQTQTSQPIHEAASQQPIPEQIRLQQQVQQDQQPNQGLLGVAFSSAPSVAHVKVSGNGYKFDF